ncbi:DUF1972 domain-containing protein [Tersicoccus sp. Bi-70]|uniref:DUF1972 domain-containing protein n=1 Tax=Tersicoccus sp. Bi-70 TaxID=1897634 RepID=UPI0009780F21|nr:DUF1972 domain-containing protein [Tersicoccus sp. Bi-70]OMH31377.1 glycosyl transferase [Tersicoccus sp. Bi-70]
MGHTSERAARAARPLRIAMVGTRGVPAAYGGFETAVEQIGARLAARGHAVTVYCRGTAAGGPAAHLGMDLVHLPALRRKTLETLSHTAASAAHLWWRNDQDVAFVFNAANAPFVPVIQSRGVPVAVHVDGLEWQRGKWGGAGRRFYRTAEALAVRTADALIADAAGIADYYRLDFGAATELIAYGAPLLSDVPTAPLAQVGVVAGHYHLVVARFEPENHVAELVEGYRASAAREPLVVVGTAPYAAEYTERIERAAAGDPRIRLLGGVWDQGLLDALYAHATSYLHGHSVGGTNPSLLRAVGAGTPVIAWDVVFNREVLGVDGRYVADAAALPAALAEAEADRAALAVRGDRLQAMAAQRYTWDDVADAYEDLAHRLAAGESTRGTATGRRTGEWERTGGASRQREVDHV